MDTSYKTQNHILFRAESPFTVLTATLIGQLYYQKAYKVLLVDALLYDGFKEKAIKLGLFNEVHVINVVDRSISKVEESIDLFLATQNEIDEYFMNTFSDCYSLMIAYRLKGKAKLSIFPEGGTYVDLSWTIKYMTTCGVCATDPSRVAFFSKYPIDLSIFDSLWSYDNTSANDNLMLEKKCIEIGDIKNNNSGRQLINKLNELFGCKSFPKFDICYIDEHTLIEDNLLYNEAEKRVLDAFFATMKNKRIIIKPHPPKLMLPYVKARFRDYDNIQFFEYSDFPWELILLNLFIENENNKINMVMPIFGGTCFMTTMALLPKDCKCNIFSLSKLYSEHYDHYWSKEEEKTFEYFQRISAKENVRVFLPLNSNELVEMCKEFAGDISDDLAVDVYIQPNDYFFKVGNLIEKSLIYLERQFFAHTYFSFLHRESVLIFDIQKQISMEGFWWNASTNNIFSGVFNLRIVICDANGTSRVYTVCCEDEMLALNNKRVYCKAEYNGYCKSIAIYGVFKKRKGYCALYSDYFGNTWKAEFWEKWYGIVMHRKLNKYLEIMNIHIVWLYGKGKIAYTISEELIKFGIKVKYVVSHVGNNIMSNEDILLAELNGYSELPDILVITPMQDIDLIMYSLPQRIISACMRLDEFVEVINEVVVMN